METVLYCPFCGSATAIAGHAAGHMVEILCSACDMSCVVIVLDSVGSVFEDGQ
jgi:transcription elongation factor Elf1